MSYCSARRQQLAQQVAQLEAALAYLQENFAAPDEIEKVKARLTEAQSALVLAGDCGD